MPKAIQCLCVAMLLVGTAHASVLSWEITNLSFDDGAAAHGRFTLDTASNTITDFDIFTTTGGSISTSFEYTNNTARITGQSNTPGGSGWPDVFLQLDSLDGVNPGGTRELFLSFSTQLTTGGTATILYEGTLGRISYERQTGGESNQAQRLVTGPGVIDPPVVPEPGTATYILVATVLMSLWGRRRMRQRAGS
jgi:hypothetical protein